MRRVVQVLLLFVAAVIVVDALVGDQGLFAMLRARRQAEELTATIARQRAENARLREEVRRLTEDPAAIEEVARRELGLIRPGEFVFIIKDLTPGTP
jgi:cell division protein FtsB